MSRTDGDQVDAPGRSRYLFVAWRQSLSFAVTSTA
jgi:hypothetical protein